MGPFMALFGLFGAMAAAAGLSGGSSDDSSASAAPSSAPPPPGPGPAPSRAIAPPAEDPGDDDPGASDPIPPAAPGDLPDMPAPSGPVAGPAEPEPPSEPIMAPEDPATPSEPVEEPEEPTAPSEPIEAPDEPAPPSEPVPEPEDPVPPSEPVEEPDEPAPPSDPVAEPEEPAPPSEPTEEPEEPTPPSEPVEEPEEPSPPSEPADEPDQPTPPSDPDDPPPPPPQADDRLVPDPVDPADTPETPDDDNTPPDPVAPPSATASGAPDLPDSAYEIGWGGLTPEEQLIVEMVNRARLDPQAEAALQNEPIASGGATTPQEALAVVPTLSHAARDHSEDMDNREFFAHTNPSNEQPWDRAQAAGHENGFVGENIGWIGSTGGVGNAAARAEAHQINLWESDGHQVNMLRPMWSEIGVGYDYGDYTYNGVNYTGSTFATQKFGDTGKTYLTGVVIDDNDGDEFYDPGEGQGSVRITAWNDDGVFATSTWSSGGYALALGPGTYNVAFEGGALDGVYETQVTIGSENVKLDVIEDRDAAPAVLTSSAPPDAGSAGLSLSALPADPQSAPDAQAAAAYLLQDSPIPPLPETDFDLAFEDGDEEIYGA